MCAVNWPSQSYWGLCCPSAKGHAAGRMNDNSKSSAFFPLRTPLCWELQELRLFFPFVSGSGRLLECNGGSAAASFLRVCTKAGWLFRGRTHNRRLALLPSKWNGLSCPRGAFFPPSYFVLLLQVFSFVLHNSILRSSEFAQLTYNCYNLHRHFCTPMSPCRTRLAFVLRLTRPAFGSIPRLRYLTRWSWIRRRLG